MIYVAIILTLSSLSADPSTTPLSTLFSEESFFCPLGPYQGRTFKYRLFCPEEKEGIKRPLVIWLHGHSNAGEDNSRQLTHLEDIIFLDKRQLGKYDFYLLAMQCPSDWPTWLGAPANTSTESAGHSMNDMVDITMCVVDTMLHRHPIDPKRIVVTGVCSGGEATWEFAARFPDRLAAAAPLSSCGVGAAQTGAMRRLPLWAFHSSQDMPSILKVERELISSIKGSGGFATITEFDTSAHDAWTPAFRQYGLLNWLLAQHKDREPNFFSGSDYFTAKARARSFFSGWTWSTICLQIFYILIVGMLIISFHRSKKRRSSKVSYGEGLAGMES